MNIHGRNKRMITELTARIEEWARERALDTANPDKQMLKLGEEFGELCQGKEPAGTSEGFDRRHVCRSHDPVTTAWSRHRRLRYAFVWRDKR